MSTQNNNSNLLLGRILIIWNLNFNLRCQVYFNLISLIKYKLITQGINDLKNRYESRSKVLPKKIWYRNRYRNLSRYWTPRIRIPIPRVRIHGTRTLGIGIGIFEIFRADRNNSLIFLNLSALGQMISLVLILFLGIVVVIFVNKG